MYSVVIIALLYQLYFISQTSTLEKNSIPEENFLPYVYVTYSYLKHWLL